MRERIHKLQDRLKELQLEAMLITYPANRRYITGFTGSEGVALITSEEAILVTDFRYVTQVQEQVPHMTLSQHQGFILKTVAEECHQRGISGLCLQVA